MSPLLRWLILSAAILNGCGGSAGKSADAAREAAAPVDGAGEQPESAPDAALEATPDALDGGPAETGDGGGSDVQRLDGSTPTDTSAADGGAGEVAPVFAPGSPYRALAVSGGTTHTCVLLDDHKVKCWGQAFLGNLGYGDDVSRGAKPSEMGDALPTIDLGTGRTAVEIGASRYSTCALLDDGQIKCWGYAIHLGLAEKNNHRGDQAGEMGDALPALDLGPGRKAVHLTTGNESACAVLDDGSIKCWSAEKPATVTAPAFGPPVQMAPLGRGVMALFGDGTVVGQLPYQNGVLLAPSEYAVGIYGSVTGGAAVLLDGSVRFLLGTAPAEIKNVRALGFGESYPVCALAPGGAVRCWGSSTRGCLDFPGGATYWCDKTPNADGSHTVKLDQPAVALTSNSYTFMCALLADGSVKCWGDPQGSSLGSSVDFTLVHTPQEDRFTYGAWRAIDLGTHK